MTESNPYAAPTTRVQARRNDDGPPLASRGSRLLGTILDSVIPIVSMALILLGTGFEEEMSATAVVLSVLVLGVFVVVQIYLLATRSQTIGKMMAKTRIDRFDGGGPAGPGKTIGMRYFVFGLVTAIPILGSIAALLNPFFIFRADRRCLHDHIAGTIVVDVSRA